MSLITISRKKPVKITVEFEGVFLSLIIENRQDFDLVTKYLELAKKRMPARVLRPAKRKKETPSNSTVILTGEQITTPCGDNQQQRSKNV